MSGEGKSLLVKVLIGVSLAVNITYTVLRIVEMEKAKKAKKAKKKGCNCEDRG